MRNKLFRALYSRHERPGPVHRVRMTCFHDKLLPEGNDSKSIMHRIYKATRLADTTNRSSGVTEHSLAHNQVIG